MKASQPEQVQALLGEVEGSIRPELPPVIPDHELLKRIGGGSYGEVWLARNILGTWRAVKIVYRNSFDHDRPFEREFAGIQKFEPISRTHESQVHILHVGRAAGYFYYVMELADDANAGPSPGREGQPALRRPCEGGGEGERLSSVIRDSSVYLPRTLKLDLQRRGRLPVDECIQIGLSLSTALAHLHG